MHHMSQAQEVAQLAVQARENANRSQTKLDEAESEVTAAAIVIDKLRAAIDTLTVAATESADQPEANGAAALLVTRELGATTDEEDEGGGSEQASALERLQEKEALLRDVIAKRQEGAAKVGAAGAVAVQAVAVCIPRQNCEFCVMMMTHVSVC